jgi:hypothetical protein
MKTKREYQIRVNDTFFGYVTASSKKEAIEIFRDGGGFSGKVSAERRSKAEERAARGRAEWRKNAEEREVLFAEWTAEQKARNAAAR